MKDYSDFSISSCVNFKLWSLRIFQIYYQEVVQIILPSSLVSLDALMMALFSVLSTLFFLELSE